MYKVEYKKNKEDKQEEKEDKVFCVNCFQEEFENIKANNGDLNIQSNKCKVHDSNMNYYCFDCKTNICIYCIKEDEMQLHQYHDIKNMDDLMPSSREINDLQKKIKQKSEFYIEIKNKINIWKNKIIIKAEELIQSLEKEIIILEKIISNYNNKFMNYTYYNNFYYLKNYVNTNNEYLIKFNDSPDFRKQSMNLIDLFTLFYTKKITTKLLKINIKEYYSLEDTIPEKINNKYFFDKSLNSIGCYNTNKNDFNFYWKLNDFKEAIYTISLSLDKKIIYACLKNKKIVKFLYFDEKEFLIKNQEIIDSEDKDSHFNKCIQLTDKYLATADNKNIKIWKNDNKEQLEKEKTIVGDTNTSDLLLVNDEYFITSQPNKKTITVININTFEISNTILNVDCIDSQNSLFSLQNFVIINGEEDIQLLLKKTIEITQIIKIMIKISKTKNYMFIIINYIPL